MESFDSSPHYMRPTSSSDAKKEYSPQGGSEHDDNISVSSSTGASAVHVPYVSKHYKSGIKNRTDYKTLKNFVSVRSFRRMAKSRLIQSPVEVFGDTTISDNDSSVGASDSSPHRWKATSSSRGKKSLLSESLSDGNSKNDSHSSQSKLGGKSFQDQPRTSGIRNVGILLKKSSFKAKRANYSPVSVHRSTFSSALKDSKFSMPLGLYHGETECEGDSAVKVCRYHHCSLHERCHGNHDPAPPPKRFVYGRRRLLKKQKSMTPKTESRLGAKLEERKNLQTDQMIPLDGEGMSGDSSLNSYAEIYDNNSSFSGVGNENGVDSNVVIYNDLSFSAVGDKSGVEYAEIYSKQENQLSGVGAAGIEESVLFEMAFGESSFPERSYHENLDIVGKYVSQQQDLTGRDFGLHGYCVRCSSLKGEQNASNPGRAGEDIWQHEISSSSLGNSYNYEIPPQNGRPDILDTGLSTLFKNRRETVEDAATLGAGDEASIKDCSNLENEASIGDHPETPVILDEVTEGSRFSIQTSGDRICENEGESTTETTTSRDSDVNEVAQVEVSEMNFPSQEEDKFQFSKQRHIHKKSDEDLLRHDVSSSSLGTSYDYEIPPHTGYPDILVESSSSLLQNGRDNAVDAATLGVETDVSFKDHSEVGNDASIEDCPQNPLIFDAVTEENRASSQTTKSNSEDEREFTAESTPSRNSEVNKFMLTDDSEMNHPSQGGKLQFSKLRHIHEKSDEDLSRDEINSLSLGTSYNYAIPHQTGYPDILDTSSSASFQNRRENVEDTATLCVGNEALVKDHSEVQNEASIEDHPETPVIYDAAIDGNRVSSQTTSNFNSEDEGEFTVESTPSWDSNVNEVMEGENSKTNFPSQGWGKLQFSKQRHISMWHLIHQHMSTNSAADSANKPIQGADNENPVDGTSSPSATESSTSCQDLCDSDVATAKDDSEVQEIEVRKLLAIKLVREAIEKILLPEVQDQTSDDQSVTSENTPRSEHIEMIQSKGETQNCEESEADKEDINVPANPKLEIHITDDTSGPEVKETELKVGRKSEKKAPKHWSNLKKWILLQRFIRELEKVRKFNPRKPKHLPVNPAPEAEKINLRHQTLDSKKSGEEWMLDYALRQAVSQLAPTQKRKVALLVKAFETVVPPKEDPQAQFRVPLRLNDNGLHIFRTNNKVDNKVDESVSEGDGRGKGETPVNGKFMLDADDRIKDTNVSLKTKDYVCDLIPSYQKTRPEDLDLEKGKMSSSAQGSILVGNGKSAEIDDAPSPASHLDAQMDRKSHIKMWHMIYQHVVSGIAEKVGSKLLDGADDAQVEEDILLAAKESDEPSKENHVSTNVRSVFTKSDVLKLVKEAVEEIQDDSSETESVTSEIISDQEILETNISVGGQNMSSEGEFSTDEEGKRSRDGIISTMEDGKPELQVSKNSALSKSKNWSKLKKIVLLRRSIKALEKAKKLKPSPQSSLSPMPDPELEKIDLKQQMMNERKKAEQWMLDYAVQHIVTKLTPARKKRVSMLVEAFEAVVPFPEM